MLRHIQNRACPSDARQPLTQDDSLDFRCVDSAMRASDTRICSVIDEHVICRILP